MNKIRVHRFDLSVPRRYYRVTDYCKHIYIPRPARAFLSLSSDGPLIDLRRINQFHFDNGITHFYITNSPENDILYIITANCGLKFEDTLSLVEIREALEEINNKWRGLVE